MIEGADPYLNLLEPASLIQSFLDHPPLGFASLKVGGAPAFVASFDLSTTLDGALKTVLGRFANFGPLGRILKPITLFGGTTVSEYMLSPTPLDPPSLVASFLAEFRERDLGFLILKDIPLRSPLLSEQENRASADLLEHCRQNGFHIVAGQALAFVPVDFESVDGYFERLSRARRKDFRRKLRAAAAVEIEDTPIGDPRFDDDRVTATFYELYRNVYRQSSIHFDELSLEFFTDILRNRRCRGVVFTYRRQNRLIGYNICFIHRNHLVDKYVGFLYPEARDANLYFLSWFHNLEYALKHGLGFYIAGWTDPEVKASLGASFTFTHHAVHLRSAVLNYAMKRAKPLFESDQNWASKR